ncbi:hypothetical protein BGW38_006769, partial [Lunasporangiospora selenospora]
DRNISNAVKRASKLDNATGEYLLQKSLQKLSERAPTTSSASADATTSDHNLSILVHPTKAAPPASLGTPLSFPRAPESTSSTISMLELNADIETSKFVAATSKKHGSGITSKLMIHLTTKSSSATSSKLPPARISASTMQRRKVVCHRVGRVKVLVSEKVLMAANLTDKATVKSSSPD